EVLFHPDCFEKSLFPSTNLALIHSGWHTDIHHEPSESLQLIYPGPSPVQQLEHLLWPVQQKLCHQPNQFLPLLLPPYLTSQPFYSLLFIYSISFNDLGSNSTNSLLSISFK